MKLGSSLTIVLLSALLGACATAPTPVADSAAKPVEPVVSEAKKAEPVKPEPVVEAEPAKAEPAKEVAAEPAVKEPVKEPVKEAAKAEASPAKAVVSYGPNGAGATIVADGAVCCIGNGPGCDCDVEKEKVIVFVDKPVEECTRSTRTIRQMDSCPNCNAFPVVIREKGSCATY